jgi:hypothetical protein
VVVLLDLHNNDFSKDYIICRFLNISLGIEYFYRQVGFMGKWGRRKYKMLGK